MIENLIFDWAGTLCDARQHTFETTNRTLVHFGGEPVDLDTYRRDFRIPVMEFYGPRIPGYPLEEIDDVFFAQFQACLDDLQLFPGAEELLRTTQQRGMPVFMLTTIPEPVVRKLVDRFRLTDVFLHIYGGAADKRKVLPSILSDHNLVPDCTLYVGDTVHDVETAKIAGARAGAALYGYSLHSALEAAEPDYLFADIAALTATLDRDHLQSTTPLVIATVGGLIEDGAGRLLLVKTRKWSNLYGLPGGKIDYGETMLEAYEREIHEECKLSLTATRFLSIQDCIESSEFVDRRHFLLINYLSQTTNPEALTTNYEISEAIWVTPEDALALPLNAPTRTVINEALRQGHLTTEAKLV